MAGPGNGSKSHSVRVSLSGSVHVADPRPLFFFLYLSQDFGYWYNQGLQHPDKIVNAIIAPDPNTAENGCMRLMRRSHTLGRIDHGTFGGQAGADPTRVVAAMSLPGYEVVKLPLMPGDVCSPSNISTHAC